MQPELFREKLLECLGGPWPEPPLLEPALHQAIAKDGYRIESVSYQVEPGDRVPALLLVPDGVDAEHPAPAVAVWHQHAARWDLGKSEPAGLAGDPMHHTGAALAGEGYVVSGKCMAWKNILDMRRAVDYLVRRPEVQSERIGCYGNSMGSTHTWLVGPWEPRLACLVGNCCLPTYAAIHRTHILHCFPNFIPGLYQYGDTPDVAALIAPRPLWLNFGELDEGSPIREVRQAVERIARAYGEAGAADHFGYFIEEGAGHVLTDAMWQRALGWFNKHLRGDTIGGGT